MATSDFFELTILLIESGACYSRPHASYDVGKLKIAAFRFQYGLQFCISLSQNPSFSQTLIDSRNQVCTGLLESYKHICQSTCIFRKVESRQETFFMLRTTSWTD